MLEASRQPTAAHQVPLYRPPANLAGRRPWYTRQEIETLPEARAALRGREIVYVADPLDALVLQIQGSGRMRITEPDGSVRTVRLAYRRQQRAALPQRRQLAAAARRAARCILARHQGLGRPEPAARQRDAVEQSAHGVLPRGAAVANSTAAFGPRGAQGVPLTPGRSIAVDKDSIPYGTPVWLASSGPGREPAAAGVGAGHRQRHRRRCARGLLHRLGAAGGRAGGAAEAAAAPVGAVAASERGRALATQVAGARRTMPGFCVQRKARWRNSWCSPWGRPCCRRCTAAAPVPAPPARPRRPARSRHRLGRAGQSGARLTITAATRASSSPCASPTTRPSIDAGRVGSDVLLRDAGGITPQQTVYSNARMRAEFGLGASGREAILRYPLAPLVAHCVRD